jgi:hypothetical protein
MIRKKVPSVMMPTATNCFRSAPAIKSMIAAVTTIRIAVLISGCKTINTDTKPISTPKGSRPARASRMRRPLLVSHVAT